MRLTANLMVPMDPRLKELVGQAAEDAQVTMNEWVARVLAERLGYPELARIPRKNRGLGRPRNPLPTSPPLEPTAQPA